MARGRCHQIAWCCSRGCYGGWAGWRRESRYGKCWGGGCEAGLVVGDAVGGLIRLQGQVSATASAAG